MELEAPRDAHWIPSSRRPSRLMLNAIRGAMTNQKLL